MSYRTDKINVYRGLFTAFTHPIEIKRLSKLIQIISYKLYRMTSTTAKTSPTPSLIWRYIQTGVSKSRLYFSCSPISAHFCSEFCNLAKKSGEKILGVRGLGGVT